MPLAIGESRSAAGRDGYARPGLDGGEQLDIVVEFEELQDIFKNKGNITISYIFLCNCMIVTRTNTYDNPNPVHYYKSDKISYQVETIEK